MYPRIRVSGVYPCIRVSGVCPCIRVSVYPVCIRVYPVYPCIRVSGGDTASHPPSGDQAIRSLHAQYVNTVFTMLNTLNTMYLKHSPHFTFAQIPPTFFISKVKVLTW